MKSGRSHARIFNPEGGMKKKGGSQEVEVGNPEVEV
jgi:hypothetical protein